MQLQHLTSQAELDDFVHVLLIEELEKKIAPSASETVVPLRNALKQAA